MFRIENKDDVIVLMNNTPFDKCYSLNINPNIKGIIGELVAGLFPDVRS